MLTKKQLREYAKLLNPIDDPMFCKMAEDREFCEEILRVILSDDELIITENIPQWVGKNLQGRSVILDAKCITKDGRHINVEIQKADDDNHQKRVRYNSSIITTNITDTGTKFELVPDVCIVFISKFDIFKGNLPLYHVDRIVRETGEAACNGLSEIYVNTVVDNGSDISELMKIFTQDDAYSNRHPLILVRAFLILFRLYNPQSLFRWNYYHHMLCLFLVFFKRFSENTIFYTYHLERQA